MTQQVYLAGLVFLSVAVVFSFIKILKWRESIIRKSIFK